MPIGVRGLIPMNVRRVRRPEAVTDAVGRWFAFRERVAVTQVLLRPSCRRTCCLSFSDSGNFPVCTVGIYCSVRIAISALICPPCWIQGSRVLHCVFVSYAENVQEWPIFCVFPAKASSISGLSTTFSGVRVPHAAGRSVIPKACRTNGLAVFGTIVGSV